MIAKLAAVVVAAVSIGVAGAAWPAQAGAAAASPPAVAAGKPAAVLKCSPHTGSKLVWYGGPVDHGGSIEIVYWGSWWKSHGQAVQQELRDIFERVGDSGWAKILTQYCDSNGPPQVSGNLYAYSVTDPKNPPRAPSSAQLKAEAGKESPHHYGSVPASIIVVTPPGTVPAPDAAAGTCGQHTWFTSPSPSDFDMPLIDIPYGYIVKTHGCGWNLKQGVAGALSVVAGHEWAESATDPYINSALAAGLGSGWATAGKHPEEVGDLCGPLLLLGHFHQHVFQLKLRTGTFVMQQLWSNAAGKCVSSS